MANFRDLLKAAKAQIREVDTAEADELRQQPGAVVLDVREPDEYEQGAIPGAVHIPRGNLESSIEGRVPDKTTPIDHPLRQRRPLGLRGQDARPSSATPTSSRWPAASTSGRTRAATGRRPASLTAEQRNRYQRHLLLPEVDVEGQLKLLDAKVLLLGAGGLGSPAALYLAAAGVGTHRHHRHGRRRRVEPAAPDPPQHGPHRRPQGRLGQEDAHAAQPRRRTSSPTTCASAPTT